MIGPARRAEYGYRSTNRIPIRQRTLTSLFFAIGALVLGLVAQDYFWRFASAPTPTDGLLALAGAVALFALAFRMFHPARPSILAQKPDVSSGQVGTRARFLARTGSCTLPTPDVASAWGPAFDDSFGSVAYPDASSGAAKAHIWRLAGATLLFVLAGGATFVSLALFREDLQPRLRWLLYLQANVLFWAAVYVLQPTQRRPHSDKPVVPDAVPSARGLASRDRARRYRLALLAILAIGAFFRLYRFAELPYGLWYDEADNGLWARQILANPDYRPIYVPSTNLPAHFLYLVALSFRLLGDSMHSIRAVSLVFGLVSIVVAYDCGRELGGEGASGQTFGLILAFLVAVSRWHVNWSRIGMHGVTVPFFELWAAAALLRGLRTRRLTAFGWAGLALGLGLCFYSPFRAFPVVLAGFLLVYGVGRLLRSGCRSPELGLGRPVRRSVRRSMRQAAVTWGIPAAIYVLGALIAVAPVAQYARRHPDLFWDRAKKVSILEDPKAREDPLHALVDSTSKHLLMFNYRGDLNGRHNLPGAPMLDRLSGVLMVFGVAMCLLTLGNPRSVLLILWLLIPLSGGILSTWFEAPQSLRSIGSLPAAYALACLPVIWFAAEWRRVFLSRGRLAILALVVLGAIGLENGLIYFHVWGRDFASWAAFNAAETRLAHEVNRYRDTHDLRFDPLLTAHLATRYLVPDYPVYHHFDPATVFPLRGTAQDGHKSFAGTVLFVAPETGTVHRQAPELYPCREGPCLQVETFAHPYSGNVVMYEYVFSREVIARVQGLDARYIPLADTDVGQPGKGDIEYRIDSTIDFAWEGDAPNGRSVSAAFPFEVTWTGGLLAPEYGVYTLHVELPGSFLLELDGQEVLSGEGTASRQIVMAQGVHGLYLEGRVSGPGAVRLAWQTPTDFRRPDATMHTVPGDALYRASWPTRGLVGRFYANGDWEGEPAQARLDRQVAYYFHFLPLPRPYTVEWDSRLAAPVEGVYRLSVQAISSASLYIDGWPVIGRTDPGQVGEGEVYLVSGLHDIQVRYLDDQSHSQIYLYWQPPGAEHALIPPDVLFPPAEGAWWPVP